MNKMLVLGTLALVSFTPAVTLCHNTLSSDLDYCESRMLMDCGMPDSNRLNTNDDDIKAALVLLLAQEWPDKFNCSFNPRGRTKKVCLKYFANRYLLKDSINVGIDLSDTTRLNIIDTDQTMEVAYTALNDYVNQDTGKQIAHNVAKTYVREKLVAVILWLLKQTNLEAVLPDSLTQETVYKQTRNEVARFYMDKVVGEILK